jgi:putative alpha-1,2-mannosidase
MYPAIPGVAGFVLASPTFSKITITLASGKTIVITTTGGSASAPYVPSLLLNGAPSTSSWVPWKALASGGTLAFTLGGAPNTAWGSAPSDRPPSSYP